MKVLKAPFGPSLSCRFFLSPVIFLKQSKHSSFLLLKRKKLTQESGASPSSFCGQPQLVLNPGYALTMNRLIRYIIILLVILSKLSDANDTINTSQSITGNQTLFSSDGRFELGFFSPGNSNNCYLGIWFKNVTVRTVVWVGNRETPLRNSTSGVLKVIQPGILVVLNETNATIWSSNSSGVARNPVVQLLDSGNLVVRDENDDQPENYLWQSFDYPTDTLLPGTNFGLNYVTGLNNYLTSWKTDADPAPGDFTFRMDTTGYPQEFTKRGAVILHRVGPWNGLTMSGSPDFSSDPTFTYRLHMNKSGVFLRLDSNERSEISRFTLSPSGVAQRLVWIDQTQGWVNYVQIPADNCDTYNICGAYGSCNIGNIPVCGCLDRFVPINSEGWARSDWSNGCVRRTDLNCTVGDVFLRYSGIRLPDATTSWYNESMNLEECRVECLRNCFCTAYTNLNISEGGSGCLLWFGELVDIRVVSVGGQDLYIRMASSELGSNDAKRNKALIASLTTVGVVLLVVSGLLYIWKRKKNDAKRREAGILNETQNKDLELPLFDLSVISKATNNFSVENKLGQGGYGPVYKGILDDGQEIAVKRLSKTSKQGLDEFKNEVICIAKLQHRNLVKLLGCCIQGEEKMLIYEYMPNKSLNLILFDHNNRMSLDWPKRFNIINGVARGLMYLHHDSRLRIIHRDLKASNILLDSEMNPKISDFGIAKRFRENETEDKTSRVVGTHGYMSPEYISHGRFSLKSDVFSFGVLVLEIVSGKRNSSFSHGDSDLNLLGHAWELCRDGRSIELVDDSMHKLDNIGEVVRVIHLGLLCVQQRPDDRPSMTSVVAMLSNDSVLPQANRPGFFTGSNSSPNQTSSTNGMTITMVDGR